MSRIYGTSRYAGTVQADLRDTEKIIAEASATLDFGQPLAVLLIGVPHFIPDGQDPAQDSR